MFNNPRPIRDRTVEDGVLTVNCCVNPPGNGYYNNEKAIFTPMQKLLPVPNTFRVLGKGPTTFALPIQVSIFPPVRLTLLPPFDP